MVTEVHLRHSMPYAAKHCRATSIVKLLRGGMTWHYDVLLIRHSKRNMYPGVLHLLYRLPEASEVTYNDKQVPFLF